MKKTELDAVNRMLTYISEATVASLSDETLDSNYDAATALTTLRMTTAEVQEQGVYTNKEKQVLSPDENGFIYIPDNCLNITSTNRDSYRNLVERGSEEFGNRLYDIDENTYHFEGSVNVAITLELPFDALPANVQNYIAMQAIITFTIQTKGDNARLPYTESQLRSARAALDKSMQSNSRPNILTDAPDMLGRYNLRRMR